jgi:quercetin dioxygenase-like cupin family protein
MTMSNTERWFMNAYLKVLLSKEDSAAGVSLIEHEMPNGFVVPLHVHDAEDETFYLLEGSVRFMVGEQVLDAHVGQALHVRGGVKHALRVTSPTARFLTVTNGAFEDVVRELSEEAQSPRIPAGADLRELDEQKLVATCERHGIEFVGPPID